MHPTPSNLSEPSRQQITAALQSVLLDGLDLHSQIKVAHWNIKGPHFVALHPLFDQFATALAVHNDAVAERAITLGAQITGTVREVAKGSRLTEYPSTLVRDLEHARLLAERIGTYLKGVRQARATVEEHADPDSADLLTTISEEFEKHAWFLHATTQS